MANEAVKIEKTATVIKLNILKRRAICVKLIESVRHTYLESIDITDEGNLVF